LQFSEYAVDYLAENGFDPQFGARPLKRLIQKEIVNQLSKNILSSSIDKTSPVLVDVFDGVVVFRNEHPHLEKTDGASTLSRWPGPESPSGFSRKSRDFSQDFRPVIAMSSDSQKVS